MCMRKNVKIYEQERAESEYYKISPDEYLNLMKLSGYHGRGISKLPKFEGKPLWITGDVNLSNTPTETLGNVGYIDGRLDISSTRISNLDNIKINGYVSDYGTPLQRIKEARILQKKRDELESYREENSWDLNNPDIDDVGIKANALFEYLVSNNELSSLDDNDKERVEEINLEINELEDKQDNLDAGLENYSELYDNIQDQIDELESERDSITDDKHDVYVMYPTKYTHYGLQRFEILDGRDEAWTVGDENEMDKAVLEYAKSFIDEVGVEGFNESFLSDYIDTDSLKEWLEDSFRYGIYDSPSSYFDDDDFELTREQEKRIEQIESEIEDYESQQNDLDPNQEDYDELYDDFQNRIDELESEKDDIIPETDSPTDDMVEAKVEEYLRDVENNPRRYINEYGLELKEFINTDELADGFATQEGYGVMNSYNEDYDSISINDKTYYIMRVE